MARKAKRSAGLMAATPADRVLMNLLSLDRPETWQIIERQESLSRGIKPIDVLLGVMREYWDAAECMRGQARLQVTLGDDVLAAYYENEARAAMAKAAEYAALAAPYLHPRLSAIKQNTTVEEQLTINMIDYSEVNAEDNTTR